MPITEKERESFSTSQQFGMYADLVTEIKRMKMQMVELRAQILNINAKLIDLEKKNNN